MTDKATLLALAERIEAAEGPCIGLDADIALAVGQFSEHHYEAWYRFQECGEAVNPPFAEPSPPSRYTASLDAALTLVPEGWQFQIHPCQALVIGEGIHRSIVATPALALCAAALRARAETLP